MDYRGFINNSIEQTLNTNEIEGHLKGFKSPTTPGFKDGSKGYNQVEQRGNKTVC